jgi:hypothetical protein
MGLTDELAEVLGECLDDPNPLDAFNEIVLDRVDRTRTLHDGSHPGEYWWAQRQICEALADPAVDTVAVPAGHSVGKSYAAGGIIPGWTCLHRDSLVVSTSPSNTQLSGVLWKEVRKARSRSAILSRIGRVTQLPNRLSLGDGWEAIGYSTNKAERFQGWHSAGPLLVLVDEASGIDDPDMWATLESLKPTKKLLLGNTLWDHGMFYETCRRADDGDRTVRKIWIPSTYSPDIRIPRSERGLADAKFLANMGAQYGVGSQTWNIRVGALFPEGTADRLIPPEWLDACEKAEHAPKGPRRLSIDLGLGNGGDDTCFVVRDDNGVLHWEASNTMDLDRAAERAATLARDFGIEPYRITWDVEGLGSGFRTQLRNNGLVGCVPYRGQTVSASPEFNNLRTACHVMLRRRLDPSWRDSLAAAKPTFAIPREFLSRLRKELREITHSPGLKGQTVLRPKEDVKLALKFSPDFADTLAQTFAFPHS